VVVLRNVSVACPADGSVVRADLRLASRANPPDGFQKQLRHHVVLPALVNAHDHLHQNGVPPLPQLAPFRNSYEWAAAFQGHFADAGVKAALSTPLTVRLWHGGLKNALSGATTVMHHDRPHGTFDATNFPVSVPRLCTCLRALFDAGCLALGTDSRLTGARDLLAELEVAAAHCDFSPLELLQLVTVRARRLLRAAHCDDYLIVRDRGADPCRALHGLQRAQLRAVVRRGEPFITDPDFTDWFAALGISCSAVWLDGQPKLCRTDALSPDGAPTWIPEQGLTLQ
jgi:hypothetical protein